MHLRRVGGDLIALKINHNKRRLARQKYVIVGPAKKIIQVLSNTRLQKATPRDEDDDDDDDEMESVKKHNMIIIHDLLYDQ